MIEKQILNYLNRQAATYNKAYMTRPETEPAEYLLIEKTGSSITNYLQTSTISIRSISGTLQGTIELSAKVIELMQAMVEEKGIYKVTLTNESNFTDTRTKQFRYRATFDIVHQ